MILKKKNGEVIVLVVTVFIFRLLKLVIPLKKWNDIIKNRKIDDKKKT